MNIKHYKFVTEYLKWGNQLIAYKNAYQSKGSNKSIQSAANRLLNHPEVAKAIYESESRIRCEVEIAIANRQIKEILTIEEKRTLLKQIAAGTMYVEQKYKGKNCTQCSQYISPTINQMLAAIREDNKLAGHHPFKQNGKWVIPALQTEQEQEETNLSPAGGGVSLSADGGGMLAKEENTTPENENKGQQIDFVQNQEASPHQGPPGQAIRTGVLGVDSQNSNTPEKENKGQQLNEIAIDNQPFANSLETSVDSSGKIISQEKLRELLYPQKPKLSYMKNNL